MIIRQPTLSDKTQIDRIYNEFYSGNEYPDLFTQEEPHKFKCSFVVTDDDPNKIVLAGGVKTIAEAVIVTDKNQSTRTRFNALLQALGSSIFITQAMKYKQIHAFVNNDDKYVSALQKFGFKVLPDKLLILDFGEPNGKV